MHSIHSSDRATRAPQVVRLAQRGALVALVVALALGLRGAANATQEPEPTATGGIITLYAHDDLASSLDFRTGTYGGRIVEGEIALDQAQLVYDKFSPEHLSFGFAADEAVTIVDLGPVEVPFTALAQDAALKFTVSAFHTLGFSGRRLTFQPAGGSTVRLGAGGDAFTTPQRGLRHFKPTLEHVYVLRYQRTRGDRRDMLAKFQVIDVRPGEAITLRWANIGAL